MGNYRFLIDLKEESSSFYGAAFADDASKTVWIAYSGSVFSTVRLKGLAVRKFY